MSSLLVFLFVWGVYLITPVLIDGVEMVARLGIVTSNRRKHRDDELPEPTDWPTVTIIIPAYNEAEVIDRCLSSVKNQDYPSDRLEIIVVDDGSTDDTAARVDSHANGSADERPLSVRASRIAVGPFAGKLALIRGDRGGKSAALNAGIAASTGEIIVNIDSDVVLTPDAVRNIALTFIRNPEMDAATGNIQVDWEILESRDEDGNLILDDNGDIVPKQLNPFELFLAKCQFLEYLSSFDLGRRSEAITSTMFTVAGACTALRRTVLAEGIAYSHTTVSEDTQLTFELHRRGARIGFIPGANVHLEPVTDLDDLYAQRVRWARGQLEVCGMNKDMVGDRKSNVGAFALPKMLLFDHTLAFPRLIWMPLFLCFPLLGYSVRTVVLACVAMYVFYAIIELVQSFASYSIADEFIQDRVGTCRWVVIGMPLYRLVVFHYRFSGFLATLKDQQTWTTSGPLAAANRDLRTLRSIRVAPMLWTGLMRSARDIGLSGSIPFLSAALALIVRLLDSHGSPRG